MEVSNVIVVSVAAFFGVVSVVSLGFAIWFMVQLSKGSNSSE